MVGGGGGGWGGIVRKKRWEDGRRWTGTKPLGGGWKRKHAVKAKDEKEKEQEEEGNKNLSFVSLHFLFTQKKTKNFCLQACSHQSTVTRGSVVD